MLLALLVKLALTALIVWICWEIAPKPWLGRDPRGHLPVYSSVAGFSAVHQWRSKSV